jgi:hypothetical protein
MPRTLILLASAAVAKIKALQANERQANRMLRSAAGTVSIAARNTAST